MRDRGKRDWVIAIVLVPVLSGLAAAAPSTLRVQDTPESSAKKPAETEGAEAAAQTAPANSKSGHMSVPDWAQAARWYQIVVPRFHNADQSHDPPGTRAWTARWPGGQKVADAALAELDGRQYGGDLQGVRARLPYLKELAVNAVILTHVFREGALEGRGRPELRHIDDTVAIAGSLGAVAGETDAPKSWKFSASDRSFLALIEDAHRQGLRVGVRIPAAAAADESLFVQETQRWMDPDGDGDPSDGIDAWFVGDVGLSPPDLWKRWRDHAKKINPAVLLVVDINGDPSRYLKAGGFDVAVDYEAGAAIRRFFAAGNKAYTASQFQRDLVDWADRRSDRTRAATPLAMGHSSGDRWLSALAGPPDARAGAPASETPSAVARLSDEAWRRACVAMVCAFFLPGAPVVYYGDEVGMVGGVGPLARAPMWWVDLGGTGLEPGMYRGDLAALVQWLAVRRDMEAPWPRGRLEPVLCDESRQLFGVARTLPGDEVILVINYGNTKHRVVLPAGEPGQLVGILSPQFGRFSSSKRRSPRSGGATKSLIRPLRIGGSRQYVDTGGHIHFWIDPLSVRVILVRRSP
jgi:glycosidase